MCFFYLAGSTLRPHFVRGASLNANGLTRVGLPLPSSRNGFEAKPLTNGYIGSSQQDVKRVLPPSLTRPPMPLRPDIVGASNGNGSQFRGVYTVTPAVSAPGNFGGGYGGFHDGMGMGRVINGDRLFPPSGAHGAGASTSHFNGGSDPLHRNGMGEDRSSENDERLIYQAALQVFIVLPALGLCSSYTSSPFCGFSTMSMCNTLLSFISFVVSGTELEQRMNGVGFYVREISMLIRF